MGASSSYSYTWTTSYFLFSTVTLSHISLSLSSLATCSTMGARYRASCVVSYHHASSESQLACSVVVHCFFGSSRCRTDCWNAVRIRNARSYDSRGDSRPIAWMLVPVEHCTRSPFSISTTTSSPDRSIRHSSFLVSLHSSIHSRTAFHNQSSGIQTLPRLTF